MRQDESLRQDESRRRGRRGLWLAIGLGLAALASSAVLVVADAIGRGPLWAGHALVSAVPLLLIAGAIAAIGGAAARDARQLSLRLVAAVAFVAWGLSQLARSPQLAGVLDDLAILLFVVDAGVAVIPEARARLAGLRQGSGGSQPRATSGASEAEGEAAGRVSDGSAAGRAFDSAAARR